MGSNSTKTCWRFWLIDAHASRLTVHRTVEGGLPAMASVQSVMQRLKKRIVGEPPPTTSRVSSVSYALAEEMQSVSLHGQLILLTQSGDPEADALACLEEDRFGLHAKAHTGRCAG